MAGQRPLRPLIIKLFAVPVLMFGFGYLMVPFYNVFCQITGLNGKTGRMSVAEASQLQEDTSREIVVRFVASINEDGPWDFRPTQTSMVIHPGKPYSTTFVAHNKLDQAVVSQSIPSVAPIKATQYFKKTECFCFTEQKFAANEEREMALTFVVDPELPKEVETIALSYTLFTKNDTN
ncbi:MAG: cytochrome c oxidase assembly protein [Thiolinea sp.]